MPSVKYLLFSSSQFPFMKTIICMFQFISIINGYNTVAISIPLSVYREFSPILYFFNLNCYSILNYQLKWSRRATGRQRKTEGEWEERADVLSIIKGLRMGQTLSFSPFSSPSPSSSLSSFTYA